MKRNKTYNNYYREVENNGSRVKILDKDHFRITYNKKHYIVPRAEKCRGVVSSFDITYDNDPQGYYQDEKSGILWINESREKNPVIECKPENEITSAECATVTLTIFREGDDKIVMQKTLTKEYENYYFIRGIDYETLPEAGEYIAIVSGMQHHLSRYNHNKYYMVIPFTITHGDTQPVYISEASCSLHTSSISGSTTPLRVRLRHGSTSSYNAVLDAQCFDSEMNLVAHDNIAIAAHRCGDYSEITIHPKLFWIENELYTIVINNSQRAMATLTFDMTHNSKCNVKNGEEIERVYRNTMHLNRHDYSMLLSVSGMSDMRRKIILQYERVRHIARLNKEIKGLDLDTTHHAIVYKSGAYEKSPILNRAYALSDTLWGKPTEMFDCQELCNNDNLRQLYLGDEVCIWTNIEALCDCKKEALHHIKAFIQENKHIILYDSKKAVEKFLNHYPQFRCLFDTEYTFHGTHATAKEIAYRFYTTIKSNKKLLINEKSTRFIYDTLVQKVAANESIDFYDHYIIEEFTNNCLVNRVQRRILDLPHDRVMMMSEQIKNLIPEDIDFGYFEALYPQRHNTQTYLSELDNMVGLENIKNDIISLATHIQFNQRRMRMGLPTSTTGCHHMIFTGNPGTGKTSVAKMIGKIFHTLGLLSNGDVIVTERTQLLGKYIGETENNMKEILHKAKGKVLFIDEAYTLCRSAEDGNDFGRHAIEALLTTLADEDADILVILAGYQKEMDTMLSINTGLRGRFPHQWHFDDYSCDELIQIAHNTLCKQQYSMTPDADSLLREIVNEKLQAGDREFSNARWIKQFITHKILPAMAQRVMTLSDSADKTLYTTIEACDMTHSYTPMASIEKKRRNRIGFLTQQQNNAA